MRFLRGIMLSRSYPVWIICATILLGLAIVPLCAMISHWQGGYQLAVSLETGGREPQWVYCVAAHDRKEFDPLMNESLTLELVRRWHEDGILHEPYRGEILTPHVRLGGRRSWIWGELDDPQYDKYVLIIVAWPEGEITRSVIDIPDYRKTKRFAVELR